MNHVTAPAQVRGHRLCFGQLRGGSLPHPEAFRVFIPWGNLVRLASSLSRMVWSQLGPESCSSVHEHAPSVLGAESPSTRAAREPSGQQAPRSLGLRGVTFCPSFLSPRSHLPFTQMPLPTCSFWRKCVGSLVPACLSIHPPIHH